VADNTTINLGTTGDVIATDEIGAAKYQRVKLIHGADGVNDGDVSTANGFPVQILSVVPGTGATSLGKAEDAAHASADVGVMALAVRTGTPANRSGADGDYEPLQISAGRLWASATIDAALPAGAANIGDVDVLTVPSPLSTAGGGTMLGSQIQ
jgi:hypothetical protein